MSSDTKAELRLNDVKAKPLDLDVGPAQRLIELALGMKYKRSKRKITAAEMNMGQEHGKDYLFQHVHALLTSKGESESSEGSSDEEEKDEE